MTTPINPLPTPPSPADSPVDFNTKAFALLGALPAFVTEANAQASGLDAAVLAAETEADAAALKAGEALASANNAAISKTGADSARDDAVIAQNAAEAALDSFDDRYLGAKSSAPATDNDGGALLTGALYWDTALPGMRSWNGSVWVTLPAATKASVGLANVDNTSDAAKSVLSATKLTTARTINGVSFDGSANISINAAAISNTPAGSISATTVQAAINELDLEKVAKTAVIAIANGGTGATSANAAADAIGAFRRGTLLGTVSQSAGVPTGAVIESGSNANGQYVRWADGTQICTRFIPIGGTPAINLAYGALFRSNSDIQWPYPAAFIAQPVIGGAVTGGAAFTWLGLGAGGADLASANFVALSPVTSVVATETALSAVGRWF